MKTRTFHKNIKCVVAAATYLAISVSASLAYAENDKTAKPISSNERESLPYGQCFESAAKRYNVDVDLLRSIAWHESKFRSSAHNTKNATPTEDIGVMQINSWWLSNGLAEYGITREKLWEPCTNIHIGAWILATELGRHGDTWTAVGYYNAKTKWKRERYSKGVKSALASLKSGAMLAAYKENRDITPDVQKVTKVAQSRTLKSIPVVVAEQDTAKKISKQVVSVARLKNKRPQIVVVGEG